MRLLEASSPIEKISAVSTAIVMERQYGLRFQCHPSLIPGIRVNVSKSRASLGIDHRGAWYTIGPTGQRASVGLPGTGLSWTGYRRWHPHGHDRPPTAMHRVAFALIVGGASLLVWMMVSQ
jgi:hypothetical protein